MNIAPNKFRRAYNLFFNPAIAQIIKRMYPTIIEEFCLEKELDEHGGIYHIKLSAVKDYSSLTILTKLHYLTDDICRKQYNGKYHEVYRLFGSRNNVSVELLVKRCCTELGEKYPNFAFRTDSVIKQNKSDEPYYTLEFIHIYPRYTEQRVVKNIQVKEKLYAIAWEYIQNAIDEELKRIAKVEAEIKLADIRKCNEQAFREALTTGVNKPYNRIEPKVVSYETNEVIKKPEPTKEVFFTLPKCIAIFITVFIVLFFGLFKLMNYIN